MIKRNTRLSGALLLVLLSLIGASLACYSDQVPGLFELTPYYTPTPLSTADDARFGVLETVLAPVEEGRAFFNLTVDAEPLDANLVNSKAMCDSPAPAQVLFAGVGEDGETYYLVDCVGSVGWVNEKRLAGPLLFSADNLAIGVAAAGEQTVKVLDPMTFQPVFNPLMQCKPETIVTVLDVLAEDPDKDGFKDIFYSISCPTTAGPLTGLVTNADLFGPVDMDSDARAIALGAEGEEFNLTTEPGPVTAGNVVPGECEPGAVVQASEAKLQDGHVYYRVTCGEISGWVDQEKIVGPLDFDEGDFTVIYVPAQPIFEDQLTEDLTGLVDEAALEGEGETGEAVPATEAATEEAGTSLAAHERKVVQYFPPLYLTDNPEPYVLGSETNVVGQCVNNTVARILDYAGSDRIYYRITCDRCAEESTGDDGSTTCTSYETQEGWVEQSYLQGPLELVVGDRVAFKSSSAALETDEETGVEYSRLPASLSGAASVGRFTEFSGRCPLDEPMTIVAVVLDKARTSNSFNFFYRVQCNGEPATYSTVDEGGRLTKVVEYHADDIRAVEGYVSARDLVLAE